MSLRPNSSGSGGSGSNAWGDPRPSTTGPGGVEKVWSDEPTPQSEQQQQQGQQQQQQQRGSPSRWRELRGQSLGGGGAGGGVQGEPGPAPRVDGRMYAPSSSSAQSSRSPSTSPSPESSASAAWQRDLARDSTGQDSAPPPGEYTQQELDFLPYLSLQRKRYKTRGQIYGGFTSFLAFQLYQLRRTTRGLPPRLGAALPIPYQLRIFGVPIHLGLAGIAAVATGASLGAAVGEAKGVQSAVRQAKERGVEDPRHFLGVFVDKLKQRQEALRRGERDAARGGGEGYEMGAGGVAGRAARDAKWERQGLVREGGMVGGGGGAGGQDFTPSSYSPQTEVGGQYGLDRQQEEAAPPSSPQPQPGTSSWQALRQQQQQQPPQSRRPPGAPSQPQQQQATPPANDSFTPPPSSSAGGEGTAVGGGGGGSSGGSRWAQLRGEKATGGSSWDRLRAEQGASTASGRSEQRGQQQQQKEEQW